MSALDLQQFCARSSDEHTHLHRQWAHRGFMYATNGYILVRVPSQEQENSIASHKAAEKVERLFAEAGKEGYTALPKFTAPDRCEWCKGKGRYLQAKCGDCGGEGEFTHGRHTYECKECDGDGWLEASGAGSELRDCQYCDGYGFLRGRGAKVGNVTYDAVYLKLLSGLPDVRVCPNGTGKAMHFTFDGGDGLLMPWKDEA